jgi:hypothetical protein
MAELRAQPSKRPPAARQNRAVRANFLLLCESAGWTTLGSPILIGLFRAVTVAGFPSPLPDMMVAMEVENDPHEVGQHTLTLRMIDEDGRTIVEHELLVEFRARPGMGPNYAYTAHPFPTHGTLLHQPGIYRLDLIWREDTLVQTTFEVHGP